MRCSLSYYCLLATRIYIFVLHAHPVRGESHNQRNATGEVATVVAKGNKILVAFCESNVHSSTILIQKDARAFKLKLII